MSRLEPLTPATAQGAAREVLAELVSRHGQVGPMVRTMAHSPAVLRGYLDLSRALKRAKLDRRISERISLAIQQRLGCDICLASHTAAARATGINEDEIALAKAGTSAEPAIAAMISYALQVYTAPAGINDERIAALRRHGYRDREIADVVGLVALNLLTGAFNLAAGVVPDT
jgi:uncharacterized peroxidase-related enzyme